MLQAQLPQLGARFKEARLPETLPASLARLRAALPLPLRAALAMCEDEYAGWSGETAAAKRRFRAPTCHALLHAVLEMAHELEHLYQAEDAAAVERLRAREAELQRAADSANAAIAQDLDEAI